MCEARLPFRRLAIVVVILVAGCTRPAADNLLFISFDTTRADHLGTYGYDAETSPNVDLLASKGAVFEHAFAHVPSTLPSHSSMFTGLLPPSHGVRCNGKFLLSPERLTLAEILRDEGFDTAAVLGAFPLERRFGLSQGFGLYDDEFRPPTAEGDSRIWLGHEYRDFERRADEVTDRALEWLEEREGPWFLFVHYFDPHAPYSPRGNWRSRFDSLYDAEIAFADHHLGQLVGALEGIEGRTLVVFTADHGESLGEHDEEQHGRYVYNATIHVPLVMVLEGTIQAGLRIEENVGHVDILPTVLEVLGVRTPAKLEGRSLASALGNGGQSEPAPVYRESLVFALETLQGIEVRSLISGDHKFVLTNNTR
jgi:arylsulfatase A-like enzyme